MSTRFGDELAPPATFAAIAPDRCMELLTSRSIGRVAWQSAEGPQVLPVVYAWHDRAVVFRTSADGVLAGLGQPTDVAFEIDELDETRHRGWSVLVRGRSQAVSEPARLGELWTIEGLVPWAAGVRTRFIEIVPTAISGRTVDARPE